MAIFEISNGVIMASVDSRGAELKSLRSVEQDSLLLRRGEAVPVHEFHYWDSSCNGADLTARKPLTGRSWTCGFAGENLYAAFPHLYFAGHPELAERFVRAAKEYGEERISHEV